MAVYEMNTKDLARFISDTKFGFMPTDVDSTIGYRTNGNSRYKIEAYDIRCDRIYIVNDCFIGTDGNIVVASHIPAIEYYLNTNELSSYYNNGTHLTFKYRMESQVLRYEIGKDVVLNSYDDLNDCMENLISYIGQNIEESMNDFRGGEWNIFDVDCDILWQVDKIKRV